MFLTKVGDPLYLKTELGCKHGHALCKRQKAPKTYLMKKFVKESASSPKELLNGQGVQKIFGLEKLEVRFGS